METLVTIEELEARCPFAMSEEDKREGQGALDDLSDDARLYGKSNWSTPATAPRSVKNLILRAAVRYIKNYEGYTQSRAGDETVGFVDRGEDAGSAYFTDREIKALRSMAGGRSLHTVNTNAWGTSMPKVEGLVPCEGTDEPIHYFSSDSEPW